jgi:hypothetical protein
MLIDTNCNELIMVHGKKKWALAVGPDTSVTRIGINVVYARKNNEPR